MIIINKDGGELKRNSTNIKWLDLILFLVQDLTLMEKQKEKSDTLKHHQRKTCTIRAY